MEVADLQVEMRWEAWSKIESLELHGVLLVVINPTSLSLNC